jgi:hypothetical protein
VEITEHGGRQERCRLDQVGAAAALHPHRHARDGLLLPPLGVVGVLEARTVVAGIIIFSCSGIVSRGDQADINNRVVRERDLP